VKKYIRLIDQSLTYSIVYVRQYRGSKTVYDVEMSSVSESRAIRDGFGQFWRKKSGKRLPDELKGITIANATTFDTRVRVRMLKELCRRHSAANPDLHCFVTNYYARPELKIKERKGPISSFTYTNAVIRLSHHLTPELLSELTAYAQTAIPLDEINDRFMVLGPDLVKQSSEQEDSVMSLDESPPPTASTPGQPNNTPPVSALDPGQSTSAASGGYETVHKKNKSKYVKKPVPYQKPT
jgi:hypothetical protein